MASDVAAFDCTFDEFKRRSKELIDVHTQLTADQLDNGWKALVLSYLNMVGTKGELFQASIVLKIVASTTNLLFRTNNEEMA